MNRKEQAMFDRMMRPRPTPPTTQPVHKLGTQRDTWRSTAVRLSERVRELEANAIALSATVEELELQSAEEKAE